MWACSCFCICMWSTRCSTFVSPFASEYISPCLRMQISIYLNSLHVCVLHINLNVRVCVRGCFTQHRDASGGHWASFNPPGRRWRKQYCTHHQACEREIMHPCVHQHLNVVSADERGKAAVIIPKGNVDVFISLMTKCVCVCVCYLQSQGALQSHGLQSEAAAQT